MSLILYAFILLGVTPPPSKSSAPSPMENLKPSLSAEACSRTGDAPETKPAKVNMAMVLKDISNLKDHEGRLVVGKVSSDLETQVRKLFEANPSEISKLEQFFGLLFYLVKYRSISDREISFDPKTVFQLLLSSQVFSSSHIPNRISGVTLKYNPHKEKASFDVKFSEKEVHLPLNKGKGFSNFKEGLCQTAKELIFYGGFSFDVNLTIDHNHVFVSNFKNVDLFGTFGSRGIVNVDIQYVSIRSVEFISGSPMGVVRAKVSKKEFEVNDHSFLLQLVSSLVTDKSTQAIDW